MGSQVIAKCVCGYHAKSLIGGGMLNFTTTCYFPCLCENCERIVEANLLEKELHCPECKSLGCTPYDDPKLTGSSGEHSIVEWNVSELLGRMLVLNDGSYKCPNCGEMKLTFTSGGIDWD